MNHAIASASQWTTRRNRALILKRSAKIYIYTITASTGETLPDICEYSISPFSYT